MPDICYGEELAFEVHTDSSAMVTVSDWIAIYPGEDLGQSSSWIVEQYDTWFYLTGNKTYAVQPIYDTNGSVPFLLPPGNYVAFYLLQDSSTGPVYTAFQVRTPKECQQEDCGAVSCSAGAGTCDPVTGGVH
jgi:hypothetical protein